jgi:hypothetical protein
VFQTSTFLFLTWDIKFPKRLASSFQWSRSSLSVFCQLGRSRFKSRAAPRLQCNPPSVCFNATLAFDGPAAASQSFIDFAAAFLESTAADIDTKVTACASGDLLRNGNLWVAQAWKVTCYKYSPLNTHPFGDELPRCACGSTSPFFTITDDAEDTAFYQYPEGHRTADGNSRLQFDIRPTKLFSYINLNDGARILKARMLYMPSLLVSVCYR